MTIGIVRLVLSALATLCVTNPALAQNPEVFSYDAQGRLVGATTSTNINTTYAYDNADNRTAKMTTAPSFSAPENLAQSLSYGQPKAENTDVFSKTNAAPLPEQNSDEQQFLEAENAAIGDPAIAPPVNYSVDERGVDLVSGKLYYSEIHAAVGDPTQGGLAWIMSFIGQTDQLRTGWRDNFVGTLNRVGSTLIVSIGTGSETFLETGTLYTSQQATGSTLTREADVWTYTSSDGTRAQFNGLFANDSGNWIGNEGLIQFLTLPDGQVQQFTYTAVTYCPTFVDPPPCAVPTKTAYRLQSVQNNLGYQISLEYARNDAVNSAQLFQWLILRKSTAFNNTIDYCAPQAFSCIFNRVWPSTSYAGTDENPSSSTDNLNRTTSYTYYFGNLQSVTRPSDSGPSVYATYGIEDGEEVVSAYSNGSETFNYGYSGPTSQRAITVTDPNSATTVAVSDLAAGKVSTLTDPANRTSTFSYDANGRLTRAAQPEGNAVVYTYDSRGNITEIRAQAKVGSGLADIVTTATFSADCSNPLVCNQPTTTTDARGNVTDYTYDPAHGGILTITAAAPTPNAPRPFTQMSYTPLYAWYLGPGGIFGQGPAPVSRLTEMSQCVGTSPCDGTATEVQTQISYGSPGVSNNLQPTSFSAGAGDGSLTATTTVSYTDAGDISIEDGPLVGENDTTLYRYSSARELFLVRAPPTGGSGIYQSERLTRDARGRVTLTELGNTNDEGEDFTSAQGIATIYDIVSRPTRVSIFSGGTTYSQQETSYDPVGRIDCVAIRMNPAAFATPLASACTAGTPGADGPDRINKQSYNAAGELTSTTIAFGTAEATTEAATYNLNGSVQTLVDGKGNRSTLEYDGFDRTARIRFPDPANGAVSSLTDYEEFDYDAASNVVSTRNRAGETFAFQYDSLNRITTFGGSAIVNRVYVYDGLDRLTQARYADNAQILNFTWDALGRQTSETGPLGTLTSQYDLADRRTRLTWPDGVFVTYEHDPSNAVTAIRENGATGGPGVLATYSYDFLARRSGVSRGNGVNTTYTFDPVSRLAGLNQTFVSAGSNQSLGFSFNPAGQIATRAIGNPAYESQPLAGATTYPINGLNQAGLNGAALPHDARGNMLSDGTRTFGFDALNQLISAGTGTYQYDPAGRLSRSQGSEDVRFLYDGVQLVAEYDAAGALIRRHVPSVGVDETVASYDGPTVSTRRWLLQDERGSVIALADESGTAISINQYDEYGVPGPANTGRFQYTGQMWLGDAGLYHYKARAYHPGFGRFLQPDPVGYAAGANLYAYVANDPLNLSDPTGLDPILGLCPVTRRFTVGVGDVNGGEGSGVDTTFTQTVFVTCVIGDSGPGQGPGGPSGGGGRTVGDVARRAVSCAADQLGISTLIGTELSKAGIPEPGSKRFVTRGSSPGTSQLSRQLAERFPTRIGDTAFGRLTGIRRIPTPRLGQLGRATPIIGRAAGRLIPFVGAAILVYDAVSIAVCTARD